MSVKHLIYPFCLTLSILFTINTSSIFAQAPLLPNDYKHYEQMRERFRKNFIIIGEGIGRSLPASIDNPHFNEWQNIKPARKNIKGMIRWGDATIYLGDYLAVLGTEYALHRQYKLSNDQTIKEIYYALQAINRLDSTAEHHIYAIPKSNKRYEKNGFCLRDDINTPFVRNQFKRGSFNSSMTHSKKKSYNVASQDQIIGLLFGLSFISFLCEADLQHRGLFLKQEAQAIADRMINYLRHHKWVLKDPIKGESVARGSNALFQSYAIAEAGQFITGKSYWDTWVRTIGRSTWVAAQYPFANLAESSLTDSYNRQLIYNDVNNSMMLRLAAMGTSWSRSNISTNAKAANMEVFLLAHALLHKYKPTKDQAKLNRLLHTLRPGAAPHFYSAQKKSDNWASYSRWAHPRFRNSGSIYGAHFVGEYNGLDWMLLYNLYHLVYHSN